MESGPYVARPDMCDAMNGSVFTTLMAETEGRNSYGDAETPQCSWDRGEGGAQGHLSMLAQFGTKHWLQGDSLTDARDLYRFNTRDATVPQGRVGATMDITGFGDEGRCAAETTDRVNVSYDCVVRAGNLVLSLDITGPYIDPKVIPDATRLDESALRAAMSTFWSEGGRPLMDDYLEELR